MLTFLSWLVVLLGSAAALFFVGRRVVRQGLAVVSEVGDAGDVAAQVTEQAREAHARRLEQLAADDVAADEAATAAPGAPGPLVSTAGLRWGRHDDEPGVRPATDDRVRP